MAVKFEVEIMGRKYKSIPALRRQIFKIEKELQPIEKQAKYLKDLRKKIHDFFTKNNIPVRTEKSQEAEQKKGTITAQKGS